MSAPRVPWLAYASLAASMALVGSYVGLSRMLVAVLPVFLLAWLRFGIAAVAMLGWLRRTPGEPPLAPHERGLLFWESFLGNFLFSICMLFGVAATSAVAAGVVMAAIPALVALLSWLFLGEQIGRRVAMGIGCAVTGVAWLALAGSSSSAAEAPWWGYALLLAAAVCEACYVVIGKRLTAAVSPRRISALINLWGLALVTPLGLWQALSFDFSAVAPPMWALLFFYALAASMITVWLWMRGLREVPAPRAGVFSVLLPLSATAVGVVFLGESLGLAQVGALTLALAGLLMATWPARA
ncbi:DMT family transporter [Ideonella sp. 4Y11]|uniref:DMT family transporter n=1 Tax=Ideonella aquatica TaxID=2824119 RepID=A0A941BQR2_9BURK|nr:DMT family transporter [Ideonella aquatica]MBQ0959400.1 DMT family transporter [Ideonella aquatica]